MANVRIEVPSVGESVKEGILVSWLAKEGDRVHEGADLFELETDKATMAVPSPGAGILRIGLPEGSKVTIGQVVGELEPAPAVVSPVSVAPEAISAPVLSPAVRRIVEESKVDPATIAGTGKGGRITKGDVLGVPKAGETAGKAPAPQPGRGSARSLDRGQRREAMSSLRKTIARRLVDAKTLTAHLTTFNEVNMERILALRTAWQETFEKRHGVRLGFMSFFIQAACRALAELPTVNAMIDGDEIVYHDVYDVGVAVSTDRGLVVPVIRDADRLGLATLEKTLGDLAQRARDKKILPDELSGGTFTITNGGVFGSLLSTPIINYPQSAILGMHTIQKRPVVVDDQIVIRPMMYVALSYDHRLIDGREAVQFLTRVKAFCENPERLLLEI